MTLFYDSTFEKQGRQEWQFGSYLQCGLCRAMLTTGDRQSGESCVCTREHQGGGGEGAPLLEGARYYVKILQFFWSIAFCHGVTICHMHQGEEMALIRWGLFESCLCPREGGRGWGE